MTNPKPFFAVIDPDEAVRLNGFIEAGRDYGISDEELADLWVAFSATDQDPDEFFEEFEDFCESGIKFE
jgi:hypothetical protein